MLVIVETRTGAHFLRDQLGIGSESDCFAGQSERIFRISDSEAGVKKKSGGVSGGYGMSGDDATGLLVRESRSLLVCWSQRS